MASVRNSKEIVDPDEAVMTILAQLEELRTLAQTAGDPDLAGKLSSLFDSCLSRYYDSKRLELSETMRHHFHPPKEFLN